MSELYGALFEIALMRNAAREQFAGRDLADFLSRLDGVEAEALRLVERLETQRDIAAH